MPIPGVGVVSVGDVIEVSSEEAERWTKPGPTRDGKMASDFSKQGGAIKVAEGDVSSRVSAQREKIAKKGASEDDFEDAAHGVNEHTGTVEEFAAEVADEGTFEAQAEANDG